MRKIKPQPTGQNQGNDQQTQMADILLPGDLDEKLNLLEPKIKRSSDVKIREITISGPTAIRAVVIMIEGLVDSQALNRDILQPLMLGRREESVETPSLIDYVDRLQRTVLTVGGIVRTNRLSKLLDYIFDGFTVILIDGHVEALIIDIRGGIQRSIEEPPSERTTRGPREGFVELLVPNIAMVRRKLRHQNLVVEKIVVGQRSRTEVAILYIMDIADPSIVDEVRRRIQAINIDGVIYASTIEQLIDDHPFSIFPTIKGTQRPDKVVAGLLQGQAAIIVDGTPHTMLLPSLLISQMQTPEDYTERPYIASFTRLFRFMAFFLAVSLPALYIALISFQPELLPFELVMPLARDRSQVAFPAVIEALIMEIVIQLVVEAGLRLPMPVGQTIGVVGGIILGQMAVQAHLATPAMVIVVAITAISTFGIPDYSLSLAIRVLRLPLMVFAAIFGMFGFSMGWMLILTHLASLSSMGVPFMSPLMPTIYADLKDTLFRGFQWTMKKRPQSIPHLDKDRMGPK